jgi:hypothetical protein
MWLNRANRYFTRGTGSTEKAGCRQADLRDSAGSSVAPTSGHVALAQNPNGNELWFSSGEELVEEETSELLQYGFDYSWC